MSFSAASPNPHGPPQPLVVTRINRFERGGTKKSAGQKTETKKECECVSRGCEKWHKRTGWKKRTHPVIVPWANLGGREEEEEKKRVTKEKDDVMGFFSQRGCVGLISFT